MFLSYDNIYTVSLCWGIHIQTDTFTFTLELKFCFCDQYIANIEISAINLIDKIRANLVDIAAYQEGNTLSSPSELGCERWSTALVWFKSLYNLLQSFINCRSWSLAIHGQESLFISTQLVLWVIFLDSIQSKLGVLPDLDIGKD